MPVPESAVSFLEQYSAAVQAVVNAVRGAVVRIERRGEGRGWRMGRARVNYGSGVVIDAARGHIITSYHVVSGTQEVRVHLADGRKNDARRIGKDPESDLALVKIDPAGLELQSLPLGDSSAVTPGSLVIALGNPDGDQPVATTGIVSAVRRSLRGPSGTLMHDLIQTSAIFNPGMSGGPLIDVRGEVIGLNTASMVEAQGVNLAVSSAIIQKTLPDLISFGVVQRPKLGIGGERERIYEGLVTHHNLEQRHGVLVREVTENGAAARAGIQVDDIIITVDDTPIRSMDDLIGALAGRKVGDELSIRLIRKLDILTVRVTLGSNAQVV